MEYLINNPGQVLGLLLEHVELTLLALVVAMIIALPLGIMISRMPRFATPVLGVLGILYTVPGLSLLAILIPFLGLGTAPAIVALVIYSQLVLVRNVFVGIRAVDQPVVEAAYGIGMSGPQVLLQVELPLALPVIMAGLRVATVTIISLATIAAWIGAGGLGRLLFDGIYSDNPQKIVAGTLAVGLLAVMADIAMLRLQRVTERIIGTPSRGR